MWWEIEGGCWREASLFSAEAWYLPSDSFGEHQNVSFQEQHWFFSTEPLQKGFRVSVGCTGCAAFSSSLSDSVRFHQLGQALWCSHKLSNSECDLISLKITCSKHFRGNQSVAAAKNEQGLKMLISIMMRKLWYLQQPLWLMEAPVSCSCLIKCYSKFWLQWQKLLVASEAVFV